MDIIPASQARHIEINAGNVLTIGILSVLWVGSALWVSNVVARTNIPIAKDLAVGAQYFLHAA